MLHIIYPPQKITISEGQKSIFLAGSIEMGKAIDWQSWLIEQLQTDNFTLLNPRRAAWDASWEQSIDNPVFAEQVHWELDGLEIADLIVMYFAPNTQSPITLLELGLFAHSKKIIVCCPDGFWRKGNVDIVCQRYGIEQVDNLEDLLTAIKSL